MTTVAEVMETLERRYPLDLAEDWDVNGLVVGDPNAAVTKIVFAVDPTLDVVREAIDLGADLLVTHHPLMLRGVTTVAADTSKGAVVHALISAGCALYTAHTNADNAPGGVSDALAVALGLVDTRPMLPAAFVDSPTSVDAGSGDAGTGRIGRLAVPTTLAAFGQHVADALPDTHHGVRVAGDLSSLVSTVAVVGGAGDSFLADARAAGVDAYVTADLRHHPASDARQLADLTGGTPALVDVSHFASEWAWLAAAAEYVADATGTDTFVSTLNTDPWAARYGAAPKE